MRSLAAAFVASVVLYGTAFAAEISIPLPDGVDVERIDAAYRCGDASTVNVTYFNAGSMYLAVLKMGDDIVVASGVMSGSGARYAGGQYVWWSKGNEASLYDVMTGDDATPVAICTALG